MGVVAAFSYLFNGRGDHETIYNEELDRCPAVKERVAIGKRVAGFYATKDYSYRSSRAAGDGWVLVGDAFGFLDPLYSSGVLLALKSGQLAADAIAEGLAKGDTSAAQLGKWTADFSKGMDRMRRLVCEFYNGFSFGRFVKQYPEFKGHLTDLLIGDLFRDQVDEVIGPMDSTKEAGSYVYGSMPSRAAGIPAIPRPPQFVVGVAERYQAFQAGPRNSQRPLVPSGSRQQVVWATQREPFVLFTRCRRGRL